MGLAVTAGPRERVPVVREEGGIWGTVLFPGRKVPDLPTSATRLTQPRHESPSLLFPRIAGSRCASRDDQGECRNSVPLVEAMLLEKPTIGVIPGSGWNVPVEMTEKRGWWVRWP